MAGNVRVQHVNALLDSREIAARSQVCRESFLNNF